MLRLSANRNHRIHHQSRHGIYLQARKAASRDKRGKIFKDTHRHRPLSRHGPNSLHRGNHFCSTPPLSNPSGRLMWAIESEKNLHTIGVLVSFVLFLRLVRGGVRIRQWFRKARPAEPSHL